MPLGIGTILIQGGRPISFESHPIKRKYLHKPIYDKEMLEILHALKKWNPCLMGRHFKVKTYHDNIKYLLEQRLSSKQNKKIGHRDVGLCLWNHLKKWKKIVVSNALSRRDEDVEASFCTIYIIQPNWMIEISDEWKNDLEVWTLIQKLY